MNSETKQCQNCKKNFVIEPEDFEFYAKIKVPPPTWCPECRLVRRMLWRNDRALYRRMCDDCGKAIISIYHKNSPFNVYCRDCWWSDQWDPMEWGRDYDFTRSFFNQFQWLIQKIPSLLYSMEAI